MTFRLEDLRQINLMNYRLIECLDDPENNLITVALTFATLDDTILPEITNVVDERGQVLREPTAEAKLIEARHFGQSEKLEFMIEFEEIEDFIVELNL